MTRSKSLVAKLLDEILEKRPPVELDHRLRPVVGERPHALAPSTREDHRLTGGALASIVMSLTEACVGLVAVGDQAGRDEVAEHRVRGLDEAVRAGPSS